MKPSSILTLLAAASSSAAAAINSAKRDGPNTASCSVIYWHALKAWDFSIKTEGTWDDNFGQNSGGLLQKLRDQCGGDDAVQRWQFTYESGPPPTPGDASFRLYNDPGHCVEDAIWLASDNAGQAIGGVTCQLYND